MSLPNYLSAIKSAGIYRFVWDKSEIDGIPAETLRLVVGYSEKGPFNTPVMIRSASEFKTAFGGISRKLEKRGVFFHRMALQALLSGPIIALNLKKFSSEEGKDEIESIGLNASNELKSDIITLHVEDIYNKVRFWNLSPETARESFIEKSGIDSEYITIYAADDSSTSKSFIIRGFKPTGYDITIKQWYSNYSEEMPDIYKPIEDTLLNQYFAEIYVFEGEFTTSMAKSKELSKYFNVVNVDGVDHVYLKPYILNAFGEKTDTLATLAADKNSNFVKMYRGITLPEFKDNYNNYISLDIVFNNDNALHKMLMDFNTTLLEDAELNDMAKYLNVSGWYDENTADGLQDLLVKAYNLGEIDKSVDDDYYNIPTGITVMGNEHVVPDVDVMLSEGLDAYNVSDEVDAIPMVPAVKINATDFNCSTTDGNYIVIGSNLYVKAVDLTNDVINIISDSTGDLHIDTPLWHIVDDRNVFATSFNMNETYYFDRDCTQEVTDADYAQILNKLKEALEEKCGVSGTYMACSFGNACKISNSETNPEPNTFTLLKWVGDEYAGSWIADMQVVPQTIGTEASLEYVKVFSDLPSNVTMIEKFSEDKLLVTDGESVQLVSCKLGTGEDGSWDIGDTELAQAVNQYTLISVYAIYTGEDDSVYASFTAENNIPGEGSNSSEEIEYVDENNRMGTIKYLGEAEQKWDTEITRFNPAVFESTKRAKVMEDSKYYEVYNGEERRIIVGYVIDGSDNDKALSIQNTTNDISGKLQSAVMLNTIDSSNLYRFDYIVESISSDTENGGDVKFLNTVSCYEDVFDPDEEGIKPIWNGSKWEAPTGISKFVTDSYNKFGLEAGDKFLGENGVSTLLAIEDYIPEDADAEIPTKTDVPIKRYIFNSPVKFLVLPLNDIEYNNVPDDEEGADLMLVKLVNPFGISLTSDLEFTYLRGFDYSNPKPASTSQWDKLTWQHDILDTLTEYRGLRIGLTEKKDLDYRYIVDTFEGFVESECKSRLSLLATEKDNCLALLNFPFIETFRKCPYTAFTDEKGQLDINFIPQGGNPRKQIGVKFSLPSETNGASWCSFNTGLVLSDGTIKTTVPPAALVSNDFMEKYVSRQPYYIVAGPNYARINDYQLVGPDFNFGRADLDALEPFGVNCMVYVPRIGTYINSNQTAKQNPVTALSKINIRELVIYLQDEIEKLLQDYQWEFNNQTLRDVIKTKADTICENVKNNGGLYEYLNVCDKSNNSDEVVDNEMIVLSTSIEGARGAGKMVQELTLYKTGGLTAMINNG